MSANLPDPKTVSEQKSESPAVKAVDAGAATRIRNFLIAMVAIVLTVALFFGLRTETTATDLTELAEGSTPLEVALGNGQPTLMEFYANWCTSCMAMAPTIQELETQYTGKVNFVMLNVDNTKWLPEILKYRVDGIPHFVFMGKDGETIASAIGELPRSVLEANLEALVAGTAIPYAKAAGQVSAFEAPRMPAKGNAGDPRSHGAQVTN
ncbi:thioredoxin family protein [Microcoleus sp. FACHB-68]|uniref:thioredoxin family protein n=1 Tax=Microcoleus sp. FACHB-68 TaxID=2692826 RepID=UPI0016893BCB|nr:thioredoxin family protein [Microcoleus sp. FACHB-68]MBD1936563.1 thiol:disulfide interchange protein [Microcoleus sp. FACHB-68]